MTFLVRICILSTILFVLASCTVGATPYPDTTRVSELQTIQHFVFNDQFQQADSACAVYCATYPDDPIGYFFNAVTLMAEMIDQEEEISPLRYDSLLDRAEALANEGLVSSDRQYRSWMYLIRGHVKAYRSIYASRFGSFTSAVRLGLGAKGEYMNALREDSANYDIYAGLGSYHYWKSAKAGLLRWLGFFRNDKSRGIAELSLAVDSSRLSREIARSSLIWIWIDREERDSAIAVAQEMIARYPEGKSFHWPLAQAWFEEKEFGRALETYAILREHLKNDPGNYYNLIECDAAIVRCLESLERRDEARTAAARLSEYIDQMLQKTRRRQKGEIGYLRRVASGK
ncbi:MAG: hypothetical protein AB1644_05595 [Candidatus Zixiibacteriota bacterium]